MLKYFYILIFFYSITLFSQIDKNTIPVKKKLEELTKLQSKSYKLGNFNDFKIYTDSILTIAKANQFKEYEIDANVRLGMYYATLGTFDKGITYYLSALEITKNISEAYKKETVILNNLGNLYNQIGSYDKAEKSFKTALEYIEDYGGPLEYRMAVYTGLSDVATAKKNFKTALEFLQQAKEIGEKLKRDDMVINTLNEMAENYLELKQYQNALKHSEKAEKLYTHEQSVERRTLSLYLLGASLVGLKRYNDAIVPLQLSQGIALTNDFLKIEMDAHKQLARAFEKAGNLEKANMEQKGYIHTREKYLNSLSKAKRLEVEKELSKSEEQLVQESKSKWFLIFISIGIITILVVLLFIYKRKRKQLELETYQLNEARILLTNENEALKIKILKYAKTKTTNSLTSTHKEKSKKTSLTVEEQNKYIEQIADYMEKEKPYLDSEMKQSTLAEELNMSVHLFSEVLNVCFEKNFSSFINIYRVDMAKQLIKNSKYAHYKILAIGYEAGFPSKTSFNRVFKKLVGLTPSEYRKQELPLSNVSSSV